MNIKLKIEFDGTNYSGWQRQKNAKTVEGTLECAIEEACGKKCEVIGCSRTDAGVHAKEYCANFHTDCSIPPERMSYALNAKLPEDIVIIKSERVEDYFHARFSNVGKKYSYTLFYGEYKKAIYRDYIYSYNSKINVKQMELAAGYFIGEHDFSAFKSTGGSAKTSIRTVTEFDIVDNGKEKTIKLYISANGFLYNMARIMAGTILDVGKEIIKPYDINGIIESKDRRRAGKTLPAKGLCLEEVFY